MPNHIKHNKKRALVQFNWIFSIVVGAIILFLALFATSRYVNLQRYKYDTELAARLSILLDPIETSIASALATRIDLPLATRIQLNCQYAGIGRQDFKVVTISSIGETWQEYGASQNIYNKYLFSRAGEGKIINVFSKQFEMPFKVADLVYLTMQNYCFIDAPDPIASELEDLNMSNIEIVRRESECSKQSITVCFQNSACQLNVYGTCYNCNDLYYYGLVENRMQDNVELLYYTKPALMYAAIFSEPELYECNVQRLAYRLSLISRLYADKAKLLDARGCGTGMMNRELLSLASEASNFVNNFARNDNIQYLEDAAKRVNDENIRVLCEVY